MSIYPFCSRKIKNKVNTTVSDISTAHFGKLAHHDVNKILTKIVIVHYNSNRLHLIDFPCMRSELLLDA